MSEEKVVKVKKEPVAITFEALETLVKEGKNKEDIGTHFGLNAAQTVRLIKESGLKLVKAKFKRKTTPAFILIKNEPLSIPDVTIDENEIPEVVPVAKKPKAVAVVEDDSDLLNIKHDEPEVDVPSTSEDNEW